MEEFVLDASILLLGTVTITAENATEAVDMAQEALSDMAFVSFSGEESFDFEDGVSGTVRYEADTIDVDPPTEG